MSIEQLRAEYESERRNAGPLLLGELYRVVRKVVRSFDPRRFSTTRSWDEAAVDDVVQDTMERLIHESALRRDQRSATRDVEAEDMPPGRQLDFIFAVAADQAALDRLLRREVKRAIVSAERRTVINRLLERSDRLLREHPDVMVEKRPKQWTLAGNEVEARPLTELELYAIGCLASAIPRRQPERAGTPTVYERSALRRLLEVVLHAAPTPLRPTDLVWIFRFVLTDWVADVLDQDDVPEKAGAGPDPEMQAIAMEAAAELRGQLDPKDVTALCMRLRGATWRDIEGAVGLSRQRLSARLAQIRNLLGEHLGEVDGSVASAILADLCGEEP